MHGKPARNKEHPIDATLEPPDRIPSPYDHRLVANAGLLLPASLAMRLGLGELVNKHVDLGVPLAGRTLGTSW